METKWRDAQGVIFKAGERGGHALGDLIGGKFVVLEVVSVLHNDERRLGAQSDGPCLS